MDLFTPTRASYRMIRQLLDTFYGGKVQHIREEYDQVSRVFEAAGGSWERLFLGSSSDLTRLKKVLKVAFRKGALTPTSRW